MFSSPFYIILYQYTLYIFSLYIRITYIYILYRPFHNFGVRDSESCDRALRAPPLLSLDRLVELGWLRPATPRSICGFFDDAAASTYSTWAWARGSLRDEVRTSRSLQTESKDAIYDTRSQENSWRPRTPPEHGPEAP
jgi:hypothetical protein